MLAIAALNRLRGSPHWTGRESADPVPPGSRREPWWRMVGRTAFPSTIGLVVLTAIALPINGALAGLLGGMLLGLGVAALLLAGEQAVWEARSGRRIEFQPGPPAAFWWRPRPSTDVSPAGG